jgi:hypothetical protein
VREEGDECVECSADDVSHERGYAACDNELCYYWEEEEEGMALGDEAWEINMDLFK